MHHSTSFEQKALEHFKRQSQYNIVYKKYIDLLRISPAKVKTLYEIPFLPIQFFKSHEIKTGKWKEEFIFESSGTTIRQQTSKLFVDSLERYYLHTQSIFEKFYGPLDEWTIIGLLPSYLERNNASLVHMVHHFILESKNEDSGFYIRELDELNEKLANLNRTGKKVLLIGISFALMELAEKYAQNLNNITIMETGGMKGRREEITRTALHQTLKKAFNVSEIHSEYGMTELFSQAYSGGNGIFKPSHSMKVVCRDMNDPLKTNQSISSGPLNIIDLGNEHTISFIATDDIGKIYSNGSFEVLGRLDNAAIRGCNLMFRP